MEINGFVYGSVTEDTLTSNEVHNRGYISKYAAEDLAWGEAPVSVAAAMLQRQRWAKVPFCSLQRERAITSYGFYRRFDTDFLLPAIGPLLAQFREL